MPESVAHYAPELVAQYGRNSQLSEERITCLPAHTKWQDVPRCSIRFLAHAS